MRDHLRDRRETHNTAIPAIEISPARNSKYIGIREARQSATSASYQRFRSAPLPSLSACDDSCWHPCSSAVLNTPPQSPYAPATETSDSADFAIVMQILP